MSYNDQADDEVIFCLPRFDSDQISVHTNGRKSKCRSVGLFHWIRCLQYSSICGYHHHHSVPATYLIGSSWKLFLNGKCVSYILTSFVGRHIVSSTTYLPTYLPHTHTTNNHLSVVEILIAHEHGLDTNKQTKTIIIIMIPVAQTSFAKKVFFSPSINIIIIINNDCV